MMTPFSETKLEICMWLSWATGVRLSKFGEFLSDFLEQGCGNIQVTQRVINS